MKKTIIIGAGPAGLMTAETLAQSGFQVAIYDAMPSAGRKFLIAGKGGLNLTHAEPYETFVTRYSNAEKLRPYLDAFPPDALREWANELGYETFVGSSGKVFPEGMQAAPLLKAWRERLSAQGAIFHFQHRWLGWDEHHTLRFASAQGEILAETDAVVLALGGGSWPKQARPALGSPSCRSAASPSSRSNRPTVASISNGASISNPIFQANPSNPSR